jgi:hypothetical protein
LVLAKKIRNFAQNLKPEKKKAYAKTIVTLCNGAVGIVGKRHETDR